jgi:hypothetical protein
MVVVVVERRERRVYGLFSRPVNVSFFLKSQRLFSYDFVIYVRAALRGKIGTHKKKNQNCKAD